MNEARFTKTAEVQANLEHPALLAEIKTEHRRILVPVDSDKLSGYQAINVTSATVPNPGMVIVDPVAWSDYGQRPFEQWRINTMARVLGAQVIAVDMPGMGASVEDEHDRLSAQQRSAIKNKNDFSDLGANIWHALANSSGLIDPLLMQDRVVMWGSSMGASTIVGMLKTVPAEVAVSDIVMWEAAGLKNRPLGALALMHGFQYAGQDLDYYLEMNPERKDVPQPPMSALATQIKARPAEYLSPIVGMAKGGQIEQLQSAVQEHGLTGATLHVISGTRDKVSPISANHELATRASEIMSVHRSELYDENHGVQDSLPAQITVAKRHIR